MSQRTAPVVQVKMEKHPNADTLSIVKVDDFCCVVRTEDWVEGQLAVYIPPDEIVDTTKPEFSFLDSTGKAVRIKAKRLRQVWSMGLLVPAPEGVNVGDNLYDQLGLVHYEPELDFCGSLGGKSVKTPPSMSELPKYDVENGRKKANSSMFFEGELVWVSEKLHGANMSVVFTDGKLYVHSRTQWPEETEDNLFWRGLRATPSVAKFCEENPDVIVYGELYGQVQKGYNYDCLPGEVKFRAFDIMGKDRCYKSYVDFHDICVKYGIPTVPTFPVLGFNMETLLAMVDHKSALNSKIDAEGIVIKPIIQRRDLCNGRVIIKLVSPKFLEKN